MSTHSINGESVGTNLLMGIVIAASAFLLYALIAMPQTAPAAPAPASAAPAIEQVVVTAPAHVS